MMIQTWEQKDREEREWVAAMAEKAHSVGASPEEIAELAEYLPAPDRTELRSKLDDREPPAVARDIANMTMEQLDDELASYGYHFGRHRKPAAKTSSDQLAPPRRRGGGTSELLLPRL